MALPAIAATILATVAPDLAKAAGTAISGLARKYILEPLGLDTAASDQDIEKALANASPEQYAKLKEANLAFTAKMKELDIKLEEIAALDRASAREREVKVGGWAVPSLATLIVMGFFGTVGYVLSGRVNLSGEQGVIIGTLIGYVSAKADQVVGYYFGSSAGSESKNVLLAGMKK